MRDDQSPVPVVARVRLCVAGDHQHGRVDVAALVVDSNVKFEIGPVVGQRIDDLGEGVGQGHLDQPITFWASSTTFIAVITPTAANANTVVRRVLTWDRMTSRLLVNIRSGTSAKGIPNESTTWLSTSASVGLRPAASTIRAGSIVIARRSSSGILRLMKPAITTWPAAVPTLDEDTPEASKAIANASAA